MGGSDDPSNLVRLTYREHFLVHWLLTRFCTGADLRKMMRALYAMSLPANGARIIASWQYDVAKRSLRDLELHPDPEAERRWLERWREAKAAKLVTQRVNRRRRLMEKRERQAKNLAKVLGRLSPTVRERHLEEISRSFFDLKSAPEILSIDANESSGARKRRRRRRPRPGRRMRQAQALAS